MKDDVENDILSQEMEKKIQRGTDALIKEINKKTTTTTMMTARNKTNISTLRTSPDAQMLRFDMLLPPAHTGEGFLALIALQFFRAIDWKWAIHWEWEFRLNGRVR